MNLAKYSEAFRCGLVADPADGDVPCKDIVSRTEPSPQDRSYFGHLLAPGGLNTRIVDQLSAFDITATYILPLRNGEEK